MVLAYLYCCNPSKNIFKDETAKQDIKADEIEDESISYEKLDKTVFLTGKTESGDITSAEVKDAVLTVGSLDTEVFTLVYPNGESAQVSIGEDAITEFYLADGSVTTVKIIDKAVTTAKLSDGSVTNVKILNGAITSGKIADGTIITQDLADGSVTESKIANGSVTNSKLADGAVTTSKISNFSVTSDKLAEASVTTSKIFDLSITAAKIATGTITGTQIASDGSVMKSLSAGSGITVTNNDDGTWTITDSSGGQGDVVIGPDSAQTDTTTNSTLHLNKTGASGNLLELEVSSTDQFVVDYSGIVTTGEWQATALASAYITSALTGKTYNGLTLTSAVDGFTIAGGTTSRTLTVSSSDVNLNQSLETTDSPTFAGATLTGFSGVVKSTAGVLSGSADIEDLNNVDVTGLSDNDYLQYDSGTTTWKPVAFTGAPADATYLTNSSNATLTNELVVSSLPSNLTIAGDDNASRTITLGQDTTFTDVVNIIGTFQINSTALTSTATELNTLDGYTGNVADFNIISGGASAGVTATEFQYLNGVTSAIQIQIDSKLSLDGTDTMTGNLNVGDNNITNVGDIALDSLTADATGITINSTTDLANGVDLTYNAGATALITNGVIQASAVEDKFLRNDGDDSTTGTITMDSLKIQDIDDSNTLQFVWNENDTSDRIINLLVDSGNRSLTLQGDLTVESASLLNQDLTTDASPTFNTLNATTITDGTASMTGGAITSATYNGLTITASGDTFNLTRGGASLDLASNVTANLDTNLTVNTTAVTLNQSLQTTDSVTFNGLSNSDANITNVGDIALDTISSDAGGSIAINPTTSLSVDLGTSAGNDFTIDTNSFVVEGDTGNVGIGTASPDTNLGINYGTGENPFKISFAGTAGTDWLSGWGKRIQVIIENTGTELTNHPVELILDAATLIAAGDMESDGADIRLTSDDGVTELDHWYSSTDMDSSEASIWVEVPTLPAGDDAIVYLYYDNIGASSTANGSDTFSFFDDFDDASVSSIWTATTAAGGTVTEHDGILDIDNPAGGTSYVKSTSFTVNPTTEKYIYSSRTDLQSSGDWTSGVSMFYDNNNTLDAIYYEQGVGPSDTLRYTRTRIGGPGTDGTEINAGAGYSIGRIFANAGTYSGYINGETSASGVAYTVNQEHNFEMGKWDGGAANPVVMYVDWAFAAEYDSDVSYEMRPVTSSSQDMIVVEDTGYMGIGTDVPDYLMDINQSGIISSDIRSLNVSNSMTSTTDNQDIYGGYFSVSGNSTGDNAASYGLYAESTGTNTGSGAINYGIYAVASGASGNIAGYFNGDIKVIDNITTERVADGNDYIRINSGDTNQSIEMHSRISGGNPYIDFSNTNSDFDIRIQQGSSGTTAFLEIEPYTGAESTGGWIEVIGSYNKQVGATNKDLYIDNAGTIGYVSSSIRYKDNISDIADTSWLYGLRPVNFNYKSDETDTNQYGLIAEEVEAINPDFVFYNYDGQVEGVSYSKFTAVLINEIQNLNDRLLEVEEKTEFPNIEVTNKLTAKDIEVTRQIVTEDIVVHGHIVGNEDTRGEVIVPAGETEVEYVFDEPYATKPIVVASPLDDPKTRYWIETYIDKFIINIAEPVDVDVRFNWMSQE